MTQPHRSRFFFFFFFFFFLLGARFFYFSKLKDANDNEHDSNSNANPSKGPEKSMDGQNQFKLCYSLEGHKRGVSSVKFSNCGSLLASCSADKTIKIWNAYDGQFQWDMTGKRELMKGRREYENGVENEREKKCEKMRK